MQKNHLIFEISPWFIILCLLLAVAYAFVLYQKKGPWGKQVNYLMAFCRFALTFTIAILVLEPLIEQIKNSYAPPVYIFAIDNSQSLTEAYEENGKSLLNKLSSLANDLSDEGYEIFFRSFDEKELNHLDEQLTFDYPTSDINHFLQNIRSDYEGGNLAGVVLLSDGIYNKGMSPEYNSYSFPVHTVALGDTVPKTDINLRRLLYNKISFQGNKFPLVAEIEQNGFENTDIMVSVSKNGKRIAQQSIALSEKEIYEVDFLLEAEDAGLQNYRVSIDTLPAEFTFQNNAKHAYIEVIEGKEKILLLASAPHPDIKAIVSALEKNRNYEVSLFIAGIDNPDPETLTPHNYNVVILYQFPSKKVTDDISLFNKIDEANVPKFYILGTQSDIPLINKSNPLLEIHTASNENDRVLPYLSSGFSLFKPGENFNEALKLFPHLTVPFGNYINKGNAEVMLHQQVGKVVTEKPLFLFGSEQQTKYALLAGEGVWQWRMQELAKTGDSKGFDDLISKTIQFLSAKDDKRRFKVYPLQNEFTDVEPVVFQSEIYNEIYEPIFNQTIHLEILNETGEKFSYQFVTSPSNTKYRISGLKEGIYSYKASGTLDGKNFSSEGEFSILKLELENMNLTANHTLLKKISRNSRGSFYFPDELGDLRDDLLQKEVKSIIYTDEQYLPVINLWWILTLLLFLISLEWFLRKYNGSY